ncbi:hypothetical protein LF95_16445 [Thalassospira sp. TSL5-1]|nr:hypothetical protein LF95_16445 [Thalassospira sp. TSL5-1]
MQGRGVTRDFVIKDKKVGLKPGNVGLDLMAMGEQNVMPFLRGGRAAIAQVGIGQHIADRHRATARYARNNEAYGQTGRCVLPDPQSSFLAFPLPSCRNARDARG